MLRSIVATAKAEDLLALKKGLEDRLNETLPVCTQLGGYGGRQETVESGFLI